MSNIQITDGLTNETIVREMTEVELAQAALDRQLFEIQFAKEEAEKDLLANKETKKAQLLQKLGITEEEASLLII